MKKTIQIPPELDVYRLKLWLEKLQPVVWEESDFQYPGKNFWLQVFAFLAQRNLQCKDQKQKLKKWRPATSNSWPIENLLDEIQPVFIEEIEVE